ncbi:hypothetical protein OnM2_033108 [Erysiphe neolycopersici]|uniref:CCHC-type domain-containing protein n=1 Tax=Erysiphe neolycopersici TaxID=212602 RepID=A0A420HY92_9PEZI|nr:hypothetical protein OnM2_033108 [Erysiphe neolycopersici]
MVVEAVLQILHSSGHGNATLDAFARFRSGPSNDEKTLDFLKRMVKAFGRLPTINWQSSEAANTIRFTLNTHGVGTCGASRPQDTIPKQQFIDPLRPNNSDKINDVPTSSVFNTDPIPTVNAATADTICYNCGIKGHFATNLIVEDPDNVQNVDINRPHEYHSDAISDYEDAEYETVSEND